MSHVSQTKSAAMTSAGAARRKRNVLAKEIIPCPDHIEQNMPGSYLEQPKEFLAKRPLSGNVLKRFGTHDPSTSNVALGTQSLKENGGMDIENLVEEYMECDRSVDASLHDEWRE